MSKSQEGGKESERCPNEGKSEDKLKGVNHEEGKEESKLQELSCDSGDDIEKLTHPGDILYPEQTHMGFFRKQFNDVIERQL